jgi:hypothetical protein
LAFRKAIQEAVAKQLALWGDAVPASEAAPPREVRPLQRDLARLLEDLADDFPLLASLVERRAGGQKRLALGASGAIGSGRSFVAAAVAENAGAYEAETVPGETAESAVTQSVSEPSSEAHALIEHATTTLPANGGARRPAHYGLDIQFEDRPTEMSLGRLIESTVWVNRSQPAYRRAVASHSLGYHIALSVAMALAPLAVEPANQNDFVLTFLSRWGEAIDKPSARKQRSR